VIRRRRARSAPAIVQALPARFTDRVRDLVDAGPGRVDFGTHHGLSDDRGVDLPGRAVLPRLR
jgi:5,10-methylenetetrahydromethanopterin reductase